MSELASLVLHLATGSSDDAMCSLTQFVRDVKQLSCEHDTLTAAVTAHSQALAAEEQSLTQSIERSKVAKDKLLAELHRIDAQLQQAEKRQASISQSKKYCRQALNAIVGGEIVPLVVGTSALRSAPPAQPQGGLPQSHVVELPTMTPAPTMNYGNQQTTAEKPAAPLQSRVTLADGVLDIDGLIGVLGMPDIREAALQQALNTFEARLSGLLEVQLTADENNRMHKLTAALIGHVLKPRPPVQVLELRILTMIAKRSAATATPKGCHSLHQTLQNPGAIEVFSRLLNSVNDDVKCEVLECFVHVAVDEESRHEVSRTRGTESLLNIVSSSTNESLLERALVFLWALLSTDNDLRAEIRQLGGLRSVLDLLYTDSMSILENVALSIGFITREEESTIAIRDGGGLEKITATLRHPAETIRAKIAGVVWNCASNGENRSILRQLGCIPALVELLNSGNDYVLENVAGAVWNMSIDPDNKSQILDYGGIGALVRLLQTSSSTGVLENVTGALWNCSAMVESRAAIRKHGGITPLLALLKTGSEKVQDNCAGALRNCAINDQNKVSIRESGGVEIAFELLGKVSPQVSEKIAALLWILTASPEVKHTVRAVGGIPKLLALARVVPISTKEKILGVLRNCATEAANRSPMIEAGAIATFVQIVNEAGDRATGPMKDATASAIWYLSRDDKITARKEGGLQLMCRLLFDESFSVVEHAAGALSSLTITNAENKDSIREEKGFQKLLELLVKHHKCPPLHGQQQSPQPAPGQPPTFSFALLNVLLAIRNATGANETNLKIAAAYPGVNAALAHILMYSAEEFAKEAALCIRNLWLDSEAAKELSSLGVVSALTLLGEKGSTDAGRKAAVVALQSVSRYGTSIQR